MIAQVYREPIRNHNGDPVDVDGNVIRPGETLVGTVDVIIGGQSVQSIRGRAETASSEGLIGCPNNAEVILRHGDRVDIDGIRYSVVGPRLFDYPNSLTGADTGRYWIRIEAAVN